MIPETLGHRVVFRFGDDPDPCFVPIIAWDDEGRPLIAGSKRLVRAGWFAEQSGVTRWWVTDPPVVLTDPDSP